MCIAIDSKTLYRIMRNPTEINTTKPLLLSTENFSWLLEMYQILTQVL